MNISTEQQDGTTLVRPAGRADFEASVALQTALEQAIAQTTVRPATVMVDCEALDYVSSAGLRAFLVAARAAKQAGVAFSVRSLKPEVRAVFDVSGFSRIIDILPKA